jgi:hypothetical protein
VVFPIGRRRGCDKGARPGRSAGSRIAFAKGTYPRGNDHKISCRWGMDCGSKKGLTIHKDVLLFVTGAAIR